MDLICKTIFFFLLSLFATSWIYPKILKIAIQKNITDNPNIRKLQKRPVPVIGGITVCWGILVSLLFYNTVVELTIPTTLIIALVIMLYIGSLDDIITLSPSSRFFIETVIILLLIISEDCVINNFHGLWGYTIIPTWLSFLITIIACVGLINAINMIDGVDGLSSGYCILTFSIIGILMYRNEDYFNTILAFTTVGALVPFFFHNVFGEKTKMFIGDGGTLVLGTLTSWFLMSMFNTSSNIAMNMKANFGVIPCALAIWTIPVFDTIRVMIMRILKGKSPFSPDRTHFHHLLIDYGFSHLGTTCSIISIQIIIFTTWWITYKLGGSIELQLYIVGALGLSTIFAYAIGREIEHRRTKLYNTITKRKAITQNSFIFDRLRDFVDGE